MMAAHEVERDYLALVWGHLDSPRGVIDAPDRPLGPPRRTRMAVREGGRTARTAYDVRAAYREPVVSLLACTLETGRTHQIRVHLQAIGHPVVGDAGYGGARPGLDLGRPFLHATAVGVRPPGHRGAHRRRGAAPARARRRPRTALAPTRPPAGRRSVHRKRPSDPFR